MSLRASVLATLAYFATQDYPLTAVEAWQWLYAPSADRRGPDPSTRAELGTGQGADRSGIGAVQTTLEQLVDEGILGMHQGFFFLSQEPRADGEGELRNRKNPPSMRVPQNRMAWASNQEAGFLSSHPTPHPNPCLPDRQALPQEGEREAIAARRGPEGGLVEERKRRERISFYKLRRARRAVRLIAWVPWIRLVAVANTLAWRHAKEESDIDLFIVTARGRIWSVRLLVGATLSLFGLRRHGTHIKDRMCLSFFVTEDALDLSKIAIPQPNTQFQKSEILNLKSEIFDIYLLYWLPSLIPLLDRGGMRMVREANGWVGEHLPNFKFQISKCKFFDSRLNLKSKILNLKSIERIARWSQLRKMRARPHGARAVSTAVVISDQMLKFHEEDRRKEIADAWQGRVGTLLREN